MNLTEDHIGQYLTNDGKILQLSYDCDIEEITYIPDKVECIYMRHSYITKINYKLPANLILIDTTGSKLPGELLGCFSPFYNTPDYAVLKRGLLLNNYISNL